MLRLQRFKLSTNNVFQRLKRSVRNHHLRIVLLVSLIFLFFSTVIQVAMAQDSAPGHTIYLPQVMTGSNATEPNPNGQPSLMRLIDRTNFVDDQINVSLSAEDPDGDSLRFSATDLPVGLSIDEQTGQIYGTITTAGSYDVTIRIDDGNQGADEGSFTWRVKDSGTSTPGLAITPLSDQNSSKDESVFLTFSVTGGVQESLTFRAENLPPGLDIAADTGHIDGIVTTAGNFNVVITVEDVDGSSDTISFVWQVVADSPEPDPENRPPVVTMLDNQISLLGQTVFVGIGASDPDGDRLAFSAAGLPTGMSITPSSGIIAGTVEELGDFTVTVTVEDGRGGRETVSFYWSVTLQATNASPTINIIDDRIDTVNSSIFFSVGAEDADGDTLTFGMTNSPPGIGIGTSNGIVGGYLSASGEYSVIVMVEDGKGGSTSTEFSWSVTDSATEPTRTPSPTVTVAPTQTPQPSATPDPNVTPDPSINTAPVLNKPARQRSTINSPVNLLLIASDPDNDQLTFSASGLPGSLTLDSESGLISGTANSIGTYAVIVSVEDGNGGLDRESFIWEVTINGSNSSPAISNPGARNSRVGDSIQLIMAASDADGDTLSFSGSGLPDGLMIDAVSGVISGTIVAEGNFDVTISVSDGVSTSSTTFLWNVDEPRPNNAPVVRTIDTQSSVAGDSVNLTVIANDPDGDTLAYGATGLPIGLIIEPATGLISGTITVAGTFTVTVMADDSQVNNHVGSTSFLWSVEKLPIKNVSRGKLADQSSTLWQGMATRAIDGNTSGTFDNNSTTHTGPERYAWWEVDLGTVYDLSTVRIWNRTDSCCANRLEDFYVLSSELPFDSNLLNIVLNQEGVTSVYHEALVEEDVSLDLAGKGRYIRIQLAGTDYLNLAEVEVFGREIVGNPAPDLRSTVEIVALSTNTDAVERSGRKAEFRIRRNSATDTIRFQLSESGSSETTRASAMQADYVVRDDSGEVVTDTLTFPAGTFERDIVIEAIEDNVPEVPEFLQLNLDTSPDYELRTDSYTQTLMLRDAEPGITADSKILLAQMTSEGGAITSASGIATVRLSNDNSYGMVSSNFTGLTSPQTAAHIHVNSPGADSGPVVFSLPIGQVTDRRWDIGAAHHLGTDQAVLDELLSGGLYLNTHTANYPGGEIRNTLLWTQASPEMQIPPDPEPIEQLTGFELKRDISRFLTQATFGPTVESVAEVEALVTQNGGDRIAAYTQWIDMQMTMQSPSLRAYHQANRDYHFALDDTNRAQGFRLGYGVTEGWFAASMYSKNQLRERVGFALSEIFVVSIEDTQVRLLPAALTSYYDMLRNNSFGPYEELLTDVSLHPAMGIYLSHLRNQAEIVDETGEVIASPDENYAREIMQLFSIGLVELHPDGSLKLTQEGRPIRTYDQTTITELARVFTGLGFSVRDEDGADSGVIVENTSFRYNGTSRVTTEHHPYGWTPMKMFEDNGLDPTNPNYVRYHDNGEKSILGSTFPAAQAGEQELAQVMTILSEHPSTAPFISYRLIQRLVISNPSAGYIYRVATRFDETDGNLGEVVKAILLDPEARNLNQLDRVGYGKKKEPLVHLTAVMRLVEAKTDVATTFNLAALQQHGLPANEVALYEDNAALISLDYSRFGRGGLGFKQGPLQAPTVFNWYLPNYAPPGTLSGAGLVAPELQHATEHNTVLYYNAFYRFFLTTGFVGVEPQASLERAWTTFERPQWLLDAYLAVMDDNGDGAITSDDANFNDPATVREAAAAMIDVIDLYICGGHLMANATGNPQTDPREVISTGVVDVMDHADHTTAANALIALEERVEEVLYIISSAPQCTMQR